MSVAGALASINQGLKRGSDKGANEVRSGLDAAGPVGSSSPIRDDLVYVEKRRTLSPRPPLLCKLVEMLWQRL